ncbi:glycoside hydrolase family 55 protein [Myxococcota bacterium]|nr:glycoside hydrolase family 55 protein [Myxococcota bacterium]MBU1535587.1 glycoside hydrolase family 55 protein [Myxococcota bacterium]
MGTIQYGLFNGLFMVLLLAGCSDKGSTSTFSPEDLGTVDWTLAGYPGGIPQVTTNVVEAVNSGALCDGTTDDAPALQEAIDTMLTPGVLLLPAGVCRIDAPLELRSGVVIRGGGSAATTLLCHAEAGCLLLEGSPSGDYLSITAGLTMGATQLEVADGTLFGAGDGAEIRQDNYEPAQADWGDENVGQMVLITAVTGNTLTISPPLHIDYASSHNPRIRLTNFVADAGIEDLTVERLDSGGTSGNNISMRRAARCWVRRVESNFTLQYHVSVSESVFVEIRDSYFHHAKSKGDGGQGYGASLSRFATSVLVENNVFYETRHAMIVQIGTSGCVFGYNYSERNYSDDGWDKTSISLHGHYPFMNLWESNIAGWVGIGDYWGPAGPGNTFFRNRIMGTDRHMEFGDYRGIQFMESAGPQYITGNEVMAEGIFGDSLEADGVLHGNNVNGEVTWDPSRVATLEDSLYLDAKPAFFGAMEWPSLGGDQTPGAGSIPARERWLAGTPVPQP